MLTEMPVKAALVGCAVFLLCTGNADASAQAAKVDETSLAGVRLSAGVRERIYTKLLDSGEPGDREIAGKSGIVRVALGGGRVGLKVWASNEWCGATGNCPVWVFDGRTGRVLLDDEDGFEVELARTLHHGLRDIKIRANMSCCEGTRHEYRFDGTEYKLVREVRELYDDELGASKVKDMPK